MVVATCGRLGLSLAVAARSMASATLIVRTALHRYAVLPLPPRESAGLRGRWAARPALGYPSLIAAPPNKQMKLAPTFFRCASCGGTE